MALKITNLIMKAKVTDTVDRFPVVTTFISALSIALLWMAVSDRYYGILVFYLLAGALLSLTLKLMDEDTDNKRRHLIASVVSHLILIVYTVGMWIVVNGDYIMTIAAQSSIILALVVGIFYLPFYREKDDVASWHFVRKTVGGGIVSWLISGIAGAGILLLINGLRELFEININEDLFQVTAIIFFISVPSMIFLSRIPAGKDKFEHSTNVSPLVMGAIRYLFIPLVLMYVAVMYLYVIKIIVQMELPNGAVSWMVTAMMCGFIGVEFLVYPEMRGEVRTFEKWIVRFLPIIILPPIILMTVGLVRRFSDYGISANRLYMMTLNVWFYMVCIIAFVNHSRRIHWIALSFALLMLLTSAHPANYRNITKWNIEAQINAFMAKHAPKKMPMNAMQLKQWLGKIKEKDSRYIFSKLSYMSAEYPQTPTQKWIKNDFFMGRDYNMFMGIDDEAVGLTYYRGSEPLTIPQGYTRMEQLTSTLGSIEQKDEPDGTITLTITTDAALLKEDGGKMVISLERKAIEKAVADGKQLTLTPKGLDKPFVLEEVYSNKSEGRHVISRVSGYIFAR